MKIIYDLREILFQKRGWESYGVGLLEELIKYKDFRFSFIVENEKLSRKNYPFLFRKKVSVQEMPINSSPRKGLPTNDFIDNHDIFHSLTDYPEFIPKRAKLVTSIHDLSFHVFPEYHKSDFINLMRKNLKTVLKYSCAVICFTKTTAQRLADFKKEFNISNNIQTTIVPHGINNYFEKQPEKKAITTLKKFNINRPYFLYTGGMDEDKNVSRLITAFRKASSNKNYMLVLAGPKGNSLLNHKLFHGNIKYLNYVCKKDLRNLYSCARFFISASLDEGFGLCPLEALKCGTQVICSDIPCFRETLAENALYFNPYDTTNIAETIEFATNNKFLFKKHHVNSSSFLKWRDSARLTFNLYKTLL